MRELSSTERIANQMSQKIMTNDHTEVQVSGCSEGILVIDKYSGQLYQLVFLQMARPIVERIQLFSIFHQDLFAYQ